MTVVQPGGLAPAHAWALVTAIVDTAASDRGASATVSILAIAGGIALLIVLFFMLRRRPAAPSSPMSSEEDRADVLARLQRHTQGLAPADADQAPPVVSADAAAPARFEARLPSIMLLNLPPDADARHVETAPPLGERNTVIERLRQVLPDLEPGATGRTRHTGPDHDLTVDIGPHDTVHTVVIDAAGETGISMVGWLLDSTGWRAFVPKAGRFVEADALEELL